MKKHPHLARKLSLLYSQCINPSIQTNADLATELGISRQAISRWTHGSETNSGDCIPNSQIQKVSVLFGIEPHWFTLDMDKFDTKLHQKFEQDPDGHHIGPEKLSVSLLPITDLQVFGREAELDLLGDAWKQARTNVVQLLAFGGVGKSTLINSWLSQLDRNKYLGARRVYAWSFHWQGSGSEIKSSGDYFIEHALEWFGDENPTTGTALSKAARLTERIRRSRTLLILDGLEPLQYPPGHKQGLVENPAVALLIRELASDNSGLCLISSRLAVADLAPFQDGRVQTLELDHLDTEAGVELLTSLGVEGENSEFISAVNEYGGHPLCLSLLGGYINVVHAREISKFRELQSLADVQGLGIHARKLVRAYIEWFRGSPEYAMLCALGLFDRAVALEELRTLCASESIAGLTQSLAGLTQAQWGYGIKKLEDANLISMDSRAGVAMIDCHPLVRDFLADYLQQEHAEIWKRGNSQIFQYLKSTTSEHPASMAELEPLFRAVTHGARAGLYQEAFQLYFDRIKNRYCMLTAGSHYTDQTCIRAFFSRPWTEPVEDLSEVAKFHLLSSAASNLMSLGKIEEAFDPSEKSINWFLERGSWMEAALTAGPFASMLIATGNLDRAVALLDKFEVCVEKTGNTAIQAISLNFRAYTCYLRGENEEAKRLFEQAEAFLIQPEPGIPVTFPTISSYYCKFLLDTGEHHQALRRSLKTFAWRESNSWQVAIDTTSLYASDVLVLGLIFLTLGDLRNAEKQLNKQVDLFRSADEWLYLPTGLCARASFLIETGNYPEAEKDLQEALAISMRTGAKFAQWEACLSFVMLYLKQGNTGAARDFLGRLKQIAGMENYRFRDGEILELEKSLDVQWGSATG